MSSVDPLREWGEDSFDREVLAFAGRAVVMFGDPRWSAPCHITRQALRRLAAEVPGVLVGVVNMSDAPGLCQRFQAVAMPTVVVFEAGREVRRVPGWRDEAVWRDVLAGKTPAEGESG